MEGKPSLTIEGTPLLIKKHSRESLAIERNPLLWNEIHCYRRKSLTIEGNALQITTNNSWKSLTIGRSPLLMNE